MSSDITTDKLNPYQPADILNQNDDDVLKFTRTARLALAGSLAEGGAPSGRGVRQFMDLMNDLDNQSLSAKRLDLDTSTADNSDEIARMTIAVQDRLADAAKEAANRGGTPVRILSTSMPTADLTRLPKVQTLEGEFSCEIVNDDYDSFTARVQDED